MLIHWIWFATRPSVSDRTRMALLQHFGDAEDVYFASEGDYASAGLSAEGVAALADKDLAVARKILDECSRKSIQILTMRDAAYPQRLKNIPDPPAVLYCKGSLPEVDDLPVIAVVGTRKASGYGLSTAKRMGYQIASCGGIVVSGMAFGVDGMATAGALSADMPAIGVLGSGVDIVYPLSNQALFADVQRCGCLVSEFPPGTPPNKWNFPKRNRIISGLSCGVLVIEAPEKSGALITARQAADQGRDVFVVPGNIDVDTCKGSNALLRDGAIAVSSGWDVLCEYEAQYPGRVLRSTGRSRQNAYADELERQYAEIEKERPKVAQKPAIPGKLRKENPSGKKKEIDNGASSPYIDAVKALPALSEPEEKIVAQLRQGKELVDDIIAATDLGTGSVLAALTMLEIKGVIIRLPGKRITLRK